MKCLQGITISLFLVGCSTIGPTTHIYSTYGAPSLYKFDGDEYWVGVNQEISQLVISAKKDGGRTVMGPIQFTPIVKEYLKDIGAGCTIIERQPIPETTAWEYQFRCDSDFEGSN